VTDRADLMLRAISEYLAALETARQFLLRPLTHVEPSTGTDIEWTDARQFALWTVERALGVYPDRIQAARDEWMRGYLDRATIVDR
jgi:hypothetical protein